MLTYYVYIVECSDTSYYTGVTNNLEARLAQHNGGYSATSYTHSRRPVILRFSQAFHDIHQAIALEKQIKGWSRKKKIAFINEEWEKLKELSKNFTEFRKPD
jgi:putative endonuclease